MSFASLFGKLQEHELELERLEKDEENEKNSKTFSLKTKIKSYESNQDDEFQSTSDEYNSLVKNFKSS